MNLGVDSKRCVHGAVASCGWCSAMKVGGELFLLRAAVRRYADAPECYCAKMAGGHCESCRLFGLMMLEVERGDHHAGAE